MDKPMAKKLFATAGIPVAEHRVATCEEIMAGDVMPRPYVVKPINEGSSVDVQIVQMGSNLPTFDRKTWSPKRAMMVERFIAGRELTVAVMGDKALAVTEITTHRGFYDYDAKYARGGSTHVIPAAIDKAHYDEAMRLSERAHAVLGCRGVSRADLRFDGEKLYMLEVNTQPGMTPTSLVPEQAAHVGISFDDLVQWMVDNAECDP
jgi:D-alanine-D-alanine ligase